MEAYYRNYRWFTRWPELCPVSWGEGTVAGPWGRWPRVASAKCSLANLPQLCCPWQQCHFIRENRPNGLNCSEMKTALCFQSQWWHLYAASANSENRQHSLEVRRMDVASRLPRSKSTDWLFRLVVKCPWSCVFVKWESLPLLVWGIVVLICVSLMISSWSFLSRKLPFM